jgi:hypothetical protein
MGHQPAATGRLTALLASSYVHAPFWGSSDGSEPRADSLCIGRVLGRCQHRRGEQVAEAPIVAPRVAIRNEWLAVLFL